MGYAKTRFDPTIPPSILDRYIRVCGMKRSGNHAIINFGRIVEPFTCHTKPYQNMPTPPHLRAATIAMAALLLAASARGEDDPVAGLRLSYEQAIDLATDPLVKLDARYVEELGKLQEKVQGEGALEKVMRVRGEIEGFAKGQAGDSADFPELRRLRDIYDENAARLKPSIRESRMDIMRQALGKAEEMKVSLTREGKLETALRAEELRKEILASLEKEETAAASAVTAPPQEREVRATVPATADKVKPLATGVDLKTGDRFLIVPNPRDKWSGGGSMRGKSCDFRGYPDSRVDWMRMFWRIGNGKAVAVDPETVLTAEADGPLHLYAEDGNPSGNEGKIRVEIILNPEEAKP